MDEYTTTHDILVRYRNLFQGMFTETDVRPLIHEFLYALKNLNVHEKYERDKMKQ